MPARSGRAGADRDRVGAPAAGFSQEKAGSPQEKQELILNAAQHVFATEGFHAARVDSIARQAGVAKGTIYLYFRSKDEILVALMENRFARLRALIRAGLEAPTSTVTGHTTGNTTGNTPSDITGAPAATPASPEDAAIAFREQIRRIITAHFTFYSEQKEFIAILYGQLGRIAPGMEEPAKRSAEDISRMIADVLARGVEAGVLRPIDPYTLACALQGMIHAVAFVWAVGQTTASPTELSDSVFSLFWSGAARPPFVLPSDQTDSKAASQEGES